MEQKLRQNVIDSAKEYYQHVYAKERTFNYIPASGKVLDESDLLNMIEASLDMWLTTGRFNDEFEHSLANYLGIRHALSTNSGSSANLLALSALTSYKLGDKRLKKGDEVITVAACFPTTVNPIIQQGLIPVFVDCELETYNIDTSKIEESITNKTKAIMIAHTLGSTLQFDVVVELCKKYNLWLIEDSCDALGAEFNGKKLGTIGHIGTYSFYPAHHITMGEGGAVVTNDSALYKIILSFRDWGRDCWCPSGKDNTCARRFSLSLGNLPSGYDHKYTYSHIGFNLKITDWQAALGISQIKKLPAFITKRTQNAHYLLAQLADLHEYLIIPTVPHNVHPSWFGFLLSVKENAPFTKQQLVEYLEENGVGTRQLFAGNILRQPMLLNNEVLVKIAHLPSITSNTITDEHYKMLPNTDFIMNNTFWVGIFPELSEKELGRTSACIHTFIKKYQ
ncbi:MAG: lipopolysaccharide biosynthesis protein RfbH [Desulfovibrionaceae bacterium]